MQVVNDSENLKSMWAIDFKYHEVCSTSGYIGSVLKLPSFIMSISQKQMLWNM